MNKNVNRIHLSWIECLYRTNYRSSLCLRRQWLIPTLSWDVWRHYIFLILEMHIRIRKLINKTDIKISNPIYKFETTAWISKTRVYRGISSSKLLPKQALWKYAQLAKYLHFYGFREYIYYSRNLQLYAVCNGCNFVFLWYEGITNDRTRNK